MAARLGSMSAPFILFLQQPLSWLPTTMFGVLSVLAGFLVLTFPETKDREMLQTIKEAELFYRGDSTK